VADSLDSRYFPLIVDVLDQGVFTVDENTRISSFNKAAESITGYAAEDVLGETCSSVFRTDLCGSVCPLRHSIVSRDPVRDRHVYIRARDGRSVPISVSTSPMVTSDGELVGGVEVFRDLSKIVDLERRLEGRYQLQDIVGKGPAMTRLFELIRLVADSESTALITGASGTGKELVARTVHGLSPRADGPFVAVNCAAIPEALLESELFGHVRGAFTGAEKARKGRIEAARGGTLFLDEIGDLPLSMQVKVLRFIQEREYSPVGADETKKSDLRLLAATHRNLGELVLQGRFREDLLFRLDVVEVRVPSLSERVEDIPLLINHLVRRFRGQTNKPIEGLTEAALTCLMNYTFPGNVRELENVIERAFVLCTEPRIDLQHLPEYTRSCAVPPATDPRSADSSTRRATEIRAALAAHNGNRTAAAKSLGMHRVTLHRWIRKLSIES